MPTHPYTNQLINETSPYLLQHAHNPVDWYAWNDETLALAKKENKLLLISIGYAACHWCHVMEHESFENEEVAALMNANYINIKIDREERPDIDQIYMNAVQLMTGSGGWPLNCVALPDGRPVWGGTYFKKDAWMTSLKQIADLYQSEPAQVIDYAEKLTAGVQESGLIERNETALNFNKAYLEKSVEKWEIYFDTDLGGLSKAPKFPMPNNYHFLLRYAKQTANTRLEKYVHTTLTKMALGGINDQIGGGFSRYSVDKKWHIPHFEKMLYDNGQLVSLYADAYLSSKNELYKETVYNTLAFVERELMHPNGGFYASLDADSMNAKNELEEGAFYVWTKEELKQLLGEDYTLFADYYAVNGYGFWEHNNYHLIRTQDAVAFGKRHAISLPKLQEKEARWKKILLEKRAERPRPRLDDKILTSWNGLMLKGYVDAYRVFNDPHFLDIAIKNATFLADNLLKEDGSLYRNFKNNTASINGYLEDYATLIDAYIALYESTFDEKWLHLSKQLTDTAFDAFYNTDAGMFYFTSSEDTQLITRKMEVEDNVIPASNSIMARNLFRLSHFYGNEYYLKTSKQMLHNMVGPMENYASGYSNWMQLYLDLTYGFYEVAISGPDALAKARGINQQYIPNKLFCGDVKESTLPLLQYRYDAGETFIYVCVNNACKLPTKTAEEALQQLTEMD